jgi:hypothetical protein
MNELLSIKIPLLYALLYLVFMCAVQALPRPAENSRSLYIWIYQFFHLLCMNLQLFIDPTKRLKILESEVVTTVKTTSTNPPPVLPDPNEGG